LLLELLDLSGHSWQDELDCCGRGNDHGLLAQGREDLVDERFGIAAGMSASEPQDLAPTRGPEPGGATELLQQVQDEPGGEAAAGEDPLEGGMDLGQQRPDPVQRPRGLVSEVLIKTRQDLQRGEDLAVAVDLAQG